MPAMTLQSGRALAGPSTSPTHRIGTAGASTSLADLYNARHAQESTASSSNSASSSSLVDLYNKRHNAEVRKERPSSSSLADLYNKQYEREQEHDVEEVVPTHRRVVGSQARNLGVGPSTTASGSRPVIRAISVESSDDNTPEPPSLLPSESDELAEDDDVDMDSRSSRSRSSRSRSHTPSGSNLQESSDVVYVSRSSLSRRGALGSATRLTMESDDEMEAPKPLELDLPTASASSNPALARPHASPAKLVVASSGSASAEPASRQSTPPIAPQRGTGKSVPQHLLASTQEDESLTSMPAAESSASATGANPDDQSGADAEESIPHDFGSPDDVVVITDSSVDDAPIRPVAPQLDQPSAADSHPDKPAAMVREISDAGSDAPIITNARIAEIQAAESSANATESESDAQRGRYPRRARNVTDYNVKRAFERFEYEQTQLREANEATSTRPVTHKKMSLPVVMAPPDFFDALRSGKGKKSAAGGAEKTGSFADYLMDKVKTSSSSSASTSSMTFPTTRNLEPSSLLTEAQARAILRPTLGPQPLQRITVNPDRSPLFQLKASTRRWLGLGQDPAPETRPPTPILPGQGTPLGIKLASIMSWHLNEDPLTPAILRTLLANDDGSTDIGRPKDAETLESATRRLRLGRAYKRPLPDTLRAFSDMENQEWIRLEEFLPEVQRLIEEQQARELGKIIISAEDREWVRTEYDAKGEAEVRTLQCVTGGRVVVHRAKGPEDAPPVVVDEESQGFEVVRMVSPAKSGTSLRLASVPTRGGDEAMEEVRDVVGGEEVEEVGSEAGSGDEEDADDEEEQVDTVDREVSGSPTPEPVLLFKPPTIRPAAASKREVPKDVPTKLPTLSDGPAAAPAAPAPTITHATSSKPVSTPAPTRADAAKAALQGTHKRDLLSYFSRQTAPAPKATAPAPKPREPPPASSKSKGKQRALDEDIQMWSVDSRNTVDEVEVFVDLPTSSASESVGRGRRASPPTPPLASVAKGSKQHTLGKGTKQKDVGQGGRAGDPFLQAEARRKMHKAARGEAVAFVDIPLLPHGLGKRKHSDDASASAKKTSASKAFVQLQDAESSSSGNRRLPQPTPSPTRGGWKGISGWYSARDAFSPTPVAKKGPSKK